MEFFGDSYDVVKRYLLHTLAPGAIWHAFPMFTHAVTDQDVAELEAFLGARVVNSDRLTPQTDRTVHLQTDPSCTHVFLDPDTGIRLDPCGGERSTRYVFGPELTAICHQRPDCLVLVFDQSLARGRKRESIEEKLAYFSAHEVAGFAYQSHACFVALSASPSVLGAARNRLMASHLPSKRLIPESGVSRPKLGV